MNDDDRDAGDELNEFLRRMMSGDASGIDPAFLARFSEQAVDPNALGDIMRRVQGMMSHADPWDAARQQALHIANQQSLAISTDSRTDLDEAFRLAELWLDAVTTVPGVAQTPRVLSRGDWVEATLPFWREIAEPVASSVSNALSSALSENIPEDMAGMLASAEPFLKSVGTTLFATQLGHVVGGLSKEVVSGGDVGLPVMPLGDATILPQNFADFRQGLDIPDDQLALYLAVRELAHARLFRHAKWLRLQLVSQVTEYARGLAIDTGALDELAERFDPSNPEELREALQSGSLIPRRTPEQQQVLDRLETVLALVEGWIEVVTADAATRLPDTVKIAEVIRRRRAAGGPSEQALSALVGLELRPRRLREAAAMWRAITEAVGPAARDALWDYPDLLPTAADIDEPEALITRLSAAERGESPARDEMDDALEKLLDEGWESGADEER